MEFENLRKLSIELEDNLRFLENNSRDASNMLFSRDEKCEGEKLLQDLCEQWKRICKELEDAKKKDEEEIEEILQEWETTEIYIHDIEEKQKEYEIFLEQKGLLVPEPDEPQNDSIHHLLGSLEISESCETPASITFTTSDITKIAVHSTPDLNYENNDDTISDFQPKKH